MKVAFLTVVICVFATLGYHWSRMPKTVNHSASPSANVSTSAETQLHSDGLKRRIDLQSLYKTVQEAIKRESAKLRITNLSDSVLTSGTETRIWVGFGLTSARCFILQNTRGKREAFYIAPGIVGSEAARTAKGKVFRNKIVLDSPQSGWDEFEKFLKEQGIDSPIRLSLDNQFRPAPDGELIVVEVGAGTAYGMVFFSVFTESDDGQKVLRVCRRIEKEFTIGMGCT